MLFNQIKGQKYISFYGGKDNAWILQFTKRANVLAKWFSDEGSKDFHKVAMRWKGQQRRGGQMERACSFPRLKGRSLAKLSKAKE
jgi:hypothetical protein